MVAAEAKRTFAGTCGRCGEAGHRARNCEARGNVLGGSVERRTVTKSRAVGSWTRARNMAKLVDRNTSIESMSNAVTVNAKARSEGVQLDLGEVNDEQDLPWIEALDGGGRGIENVAHEGLCMTARRGAGNGQWRPANRRETGRKGRL